MEIMKRSSAVLILWVVIYVTSEMVGISRGDEPSTEKQVSSVQMLGHTMMIDSQENWAGQLTDSNTLNNCTYTVLIETTCIKGAGTSDHISLRFGDSNSGDILVHHLNNKHLRQIDGEHVNILNDVRNQPFRACGVDQFHVTGRCVESPVCYLFLKHRGEDNWRPGIVQVLLPSTSDYSSRQFYFRRFLPRNVWHGSDACDTGVTPFGIKHTRKVFTDKHKLLTKVLF